LVRVATLDEFVLFVNIEMFLFKALIVFVVTFICYYICANC